jgi:hypothetical protein
MTDFYHLEVVVVAAAGLQGGDPVQGGAGQHVQQDSPAQGPKHTAHNHRDQKMTLEKYRYFITTIETKDDLETVYCITTIENKDDLETVLYYNHRDQG